MLAGAGEIDDVLGFVHSRHVEGDWVFGGCDAIGVFDWSHVEGFAFDIDVGVVVALVDAFEGGEGEGRGWDLAFDHPGGAGEAVGDLFADDFIGAASGHHQDGEEGEKEVF